MSTRKLTLLLLLSIFAIISFAMEGHKCTHGLQGNPEPEPMDIEEDFNPQGEDDGRSLASVVYNNMRIYPYFGLLNTTATANNADYFQNKLIPPIADYFQAALKVRYPISGLWKTTGATVCSASTPAELKTGVSADFVWVVVVNDSPDYIANTYTCNRASGSNRPIAGQTAISTQFMNAVTGVLSHEKNMICIMHELTHALGFSTYMYPYFLNATTGKQLSGHILTDTLDGATATVLNVEPLTTRLRNFYGCSTLKGAYMENSGSSATAGSHFERKIFAFEMMTSGSIFQQQISQFTLALLEGSGWYVPDYTYADPFYFGQGQGCNFIFQTCPSTQFSEYCSASGNLCTNVGRGGGSCSSDTRADNCKWVMPNLNYDCENVNSEPYARLPALQTFGRNTGSKCFTGTLNSGKSAGSSTTFCFKQSCSGSGTNTTLTLTVGGKSVVCTAAGTKTISGYAGVINCPDPVKFCNTVGLKVCPRNCMGRGTCVNGTCQCKTGYVGEDCAFWA